MALSLLLILFAVGCLLSLLYCRVKNRLLGLPPGPMPLPIIGNIFSLAGEMDKVFLGWKKQYGNVYTIWMPHATVVINDAETLKATVAAEGDLYGARQPFAELMKMFFGGLFGLIFNDNSMWREQRRFALHTLRDLGLGTNTMQDTANFLIHRAVDVLRTSEGEVIDITPHLTSCVGNVIKSLTFGRITGHDDPVSIRFKQLIDEVIQGSNSPLVQAIEFIPALKHFDSLLGIGLKKSVIANDQVMDEIDREVTEREAALDMEATPKCFIDAFLQEMERRKREGEELGSFTRHQMIVAAYDLYTAGLETTVSTLRFTILYMLNNPKVQDKLHAEIDEQIGKRDVRMEDQRLLPYTCAVIQETHRCAVLLPAIAPRLLLEPAEIAGYQIPAGTAVMPQFQSIMIDDEIFERADFFCPERHLNESGEFVKDPRIMAFSVGKRACIGEGLARMELFIFLVTLLQHFRFTPEGVVPPRPERIDGFLRSPKPYKCRIYAREK